MAASLSPLPIAIELQWITDWSAVWPSRNLERCKRAAQFTTRPLRIGGAQLLTAIPKLCQFTLIRRPSSKWPRAVALVAAAAVAAAVAVAAVKVALAARVGDHPAAEP